MALPIKIITKADFEDIIELPANMRDEKLNPQIVKAQEFDLAKLMGEDFYYYFLSWFKEDGTLKTDAPQEIKDLYNGSTYTSNEISKNNPGIKPVIVCYTGARLVRKVDAHITPNGYMDKVNEFSEHVSGSRKAFDSNEYDNQALAYWHKVLRFMESDKNLFTQYFTDSCGCNSGGKGSVKPKMVSIGGNDCNYNNYSGYGKLRYSRR